MPLPPVPFTARAQLHYTILGQRALNTIYVESQASIPWTTLLLNTLSTTIETSWEANIRPRQVDDTVLDRIVVRDLGTANGEQRENASGLAGTLAGDPAPGWIAACVSWRTAVTGRSFHGRTYHMGLSEQVMEDNFMTEAYRALVETSYGDLRGDIEAADPDWRMVVVSYFTNNAQRPVPNTAVIISESVDRRLDSMNSRKPRPA